MIVCVKHRVRANYGRVFFFLLGERLGTMCIFCWCFGAVAVANSYTNIHCTARRSLTEVWIGGWQGGRIGFVVSAVGLTGRNEEVSSGRTHNTGHNEFKKWRTHDYRTDGLFITRISQSPSFSLFLSTATLQTARFFTRVCAASSSESEQQRLGVCVCV